MSSVHAKEPQASPDARAEESPMSDVQALAYALASVVRGRVATTSEDIIDARLVIAELHLLGRAIGPAGMVPCVTSSATRPQSAG